MERAVIGAGGMGVVCRAHNAHLDRFPAIKPLPPGRLADPDREACFARERP